MFYIRLKCIADAVARSLLPLKAKALYPFSLKPDLDSAVFFVQNTVICRFPQGVVP